MAASLQVLAPGQDLFEESVGAGVAVDTIFNIA
jgi:hypothetical protein